MIAIGPYSTPTVVFTANVAGVHMFQTVSSSSSVPNLSFSGDREASSEPSILTSGSSPRQRTATVYLEPGDDVLYEGPAANLSVFVLGS